VDLFEAALDDAGWDSFSRGSAIRRAGRAGFARNVCVALGNWGDPSAVAVLSEAPGDPEALVRRHAAWALGRIHASDSSEALRSVQSRETDPAVREEIHRALVR
jgi:epoxyqueuosine reductase